MLFRSVSAFFCRAVFLPISARSARVSGLRTGISPIASASCSSVSTSSPDTWTGYRKNACRASKAGNSRRNLHLSELLAFSSVIHTNPSLTTNLDPPFYCVSMSYRLTSLSFLVHKKEFFDIRRGHYLFLLYRLRLQKSRKLRWDNPCMKCILLHRSDCIVSTCPRSTKQHRLYRCKCPYFGHRKVLRIRKLVPDIEQIGLLAYGSCIRPPLLEVKLHTHPLGRL